jgi:hypothetical protein
MIPVRMQAVNNVPFALDIMISGFIKKPADELPAGYGPFYTIPKSIKLIGSPEILPADYLSGFIHKHRTET